MLNPHTHNQRFYPMQIQHVNTGKVLALPPHKRNSEDEWEQEDSGADGPSASLLRISPRPTSTISFDGTSGIFGRNYESRAHKASVKPAEDPLPKPIPITKREKDRPDWKPAQEIAAQTLTIDDAASDEIDQNESKRFTWLITGLLAGGPHPLSYAANLDFIYDAGFNAFLYVFDESTDNDSLYDFEHQLLLPDIDLMKACNFIDRMIESKTPVFVSCFDGLDKTGSILAGYFIYKGYLTSDEAIAYVRQNYNTDAIKDEQEDALHKFAHSL